MFKIPFGAPVKTRQQPRIKQITPRQLQAEMGSDDLLLLDVRSPLEYERGGHIAGSRLLPLPTLAQRSGELPRDRTIVCICRSGSRSMVACEQLRQAGFDVVNLRGGILGWEGAGYPLH